MTKPTCATAGAALLIGIASLNGSARAQEAQPTTPPEPPTFDAQVTPTLVGVNDILSYRALPSYSEPEWVTENYVSKGLLPPVAERLPKEPLVYATANMPAGIGVYGDVLRHVIGGRPEGWNYTAGQSQGWGGIDIGLSECLTRTGPLFEVKAEELQPLPNLAMSWDWSADGMSLTVNLIEGAKWSDGDPFDTEDIRFYWEDEVMDPEVTPLNGASPETFGAGTTMTIDGPYQFTWHFTSPFPEQVLYAMAYGTFCPGPSHILEPQHPKYNKDATYDSFRNAFPPEYMNFPVMGAWVPVEYRPDDIIVMRRNPYYWKVDEEGHQLPYLDEIQYRLSTWTDRDIQAAAGTGDYTNLEQPENYVEALRRSANPEAPTRLEFGPRTIGYSLLFNFSGNGWGEPDARAQAVRDLNRNLDFRIAVTSALDRQAIGNSLVKGPFTAIYPGGIYRASAYYDNDATAYYPFDMDVARAYLARAGLVDTDGNGFVNFPEGVAGGEDVQIALLSETDIQTNANVAEAVIAQMEDLGLKVVANFLSSNDATAALDAGRWDWHVFRNQSELITVVQNTTQLAAVGPQTLRFHRAGTDGTLDLLPFETELVDIINAFVGTSDREKRISLMRDYQKIFTENVYSAGLTQYSAALMINKRFANVPEGAPNFMFNWGEDSIMRERMWVPLDRQADWELHPGTLPGSPGEAM